MLKRNVQKLLADALSKSPFPQVEDLVKEIKELIGPADAVPKLKKEIAELQLQRDKEVKELKLQRDIEERDLKHLIKIKEEKLIVEHQKKNLDLEKTYQEKEMVLREEHHKTIMSGLEDYQKRQDVFFTEVMKRLPNVNMDISHDIIKDNSKKGKDG